MSQTNFCLHEGDNVSDNSPVILCLKMQIMNVPSEKHSLRGEKVWGYYCVTECVPVDALYCEELTCTTHKDNIDTY